MPNNDFNSSPEQGESFEGPGFKPVYKGVTEENLQETKGRLRAFVLAKAREKLSLLEKGKSNLISHAESKKEELINSAAIDYDLNKEEIEKKYAAVIERLQALKQSEKPDSVSSSVVQEESVEAENAPAKAREELAKEIGELIDRLDSKLHFSEDEKKNIKEALMLRAEKGGKREVPIEELEHLKKGFEGIIEISEKLQKVKELELEKEAELLRINEEFETAKEEAEEEYQRILGHLSLVNAKTLETRRQALAALKGIEEANVAVAGQLVRDYGLDKADELVRVAEQDKNTKTSPVTSVFMSAAAAALIGIGIHNYHRPEPIQPVLRAASEPADSRMVFKIDYQQFIGAPQVITSHYKKPEAAVKKSVSTVPAPKIAKPKVKQHLNRKRPAAKIQKKESGFVVAANNLANTANILIIIDENAKLNQKVKYGELGLFFETTRSITKDFLKNLETKVKNNKLDSKQAAAAKYLMERTNILLKIKLKNNKAVVSSLRDLGQVSIHEYNLEILRSVRKQIDKQIKENKFAEKIANKLNKQGSVAPAKKAAKQSKARKSK